MTREEAIEILKSGMDRNDDMSCELVEAVSIAIRALWQQPYEFFEKGTMSLQEAIEKEKSIVKRNYELAGAYQTDWNVYLKQEGACRERAEYHEQVAEWLEELQRLKEQEPCEERERGECPFYAS